MKFFKNLQTWLVVAAFVGTIGILFGGQALNAKFKVNQPLESELMGKREIQSFAVRPGDEGLTIELKLKRTVNLQKLLEFVKTKAELYHKKPVTAFIVKSNSNGRLERIRYELSFYLEEALASGHYIQLKAALDNLKSNGLTSKVYLAEDFIYVQLEEGSNYLYQALPRISKLVALNNTDPGGGSL